MSQALEALKQRQEQIVHELVKLERQLYEGETQYFMSDCTISGNVLKGYEGFLTSKNAAAKNRNRAFKAEDRLFSLSSTTSPASQEAQTEQEAARLEALGGRGYGGGYVASKRRH